MKKLFSKVCLVVLAASSIIGLSGCNKNEYAVGEYKVRVTPSCATNGFWKITKGPKYKNETGYYEKQGTKKDMDKDGKKETIYIAVFDDYKLSYTVYKGSKDQKWHYKKNK